MNQTVVKQKINSCVDKLYTQDRYLFNCKVCERCLMFRLAYYLQEEFPDYFVDCEFNKMGFNEYKHESKVEPTRQGSELKKMYADIIVHKRNSSTRDNFICLEIKRTKNGLDNDLERLKIMTNQNGFRYKDKNYKYAYDYGFSVRLPRSKDKSETRIFEDGKETL